MLASCASSDGIGPEPAPVPGARTLAVLPIPRLVPAPTTAEYTAALQLVYGAGARGIVRTDTWAKLEPSPGVYDFTDLSSTLDGYTANGYTVIFEGLQLINTVKREVPADLAATAWDDPAMIARFHALIDHLVPVLGGRTAYLSIGNEVASYLDTANEWVAYGAFYTDAVAYVHAKLPGARVGVTVAFGVIAPGDSAKIVALNALSDVAMFTYYPSDGSYRPSGPTATRAAFPAMLALARGKPVVLQELGYPSATALGSSEGEQAQFITDAIAQWAAIDAPRMPFTSVFALTDFSPALCDQYAQYYSQVGSADFEAFICSLGLRHADGTEKPGWAALQRAAAAAGLP